MLWLTACTSLRFLHRLSKPARWCPLPMSHICSCCRGRKRWILSVPVKGSLQMDAGAVRAVEVRSKSLFSAGIVAVSGDFNAQDAVQLCDGDGRELGRGLCNYSAAEVDQIKVSANASCLCGQGIPTLMCSKCRLSRPETSTTAHSMSGNCHCVAFWGELSTTVPSIHDAE